MPASCSVALYSEGATCGDHWYFWFEMINFLSALPITEPISPSMFSHELCSFPCYSWLSGSLDFSARRLIRWDNFDSPIVARCTMWKNMLVRYLLFVVKMHVFGDLTVDLTISWTWYFEVSRWISAMPCQSNCRSFDCRTSSMMDVQERWMPLLQYTERNPIGLGLSIGSMRLDHHNSIGLEC